MGDVWRPVIASSLVGTTANGSSAIRGLHSNDELKGLNQVINSRVLLHCDGVLLLVFFPLLCNFL